MLNKLKILLFTFCLVVAFSFANAAQNQIVSTGVRKISDNTVNFTFYTSGDNLEKPIVRSKGNNEYSILLPNLSDSTSRAINLGSTDGIVTSADVKTINEGAVTYTKINVKTTKPVTINAETRKTSQTASDISNLNSIVSKVNLINQDIQNTKSIPATSTSTQPSEYSQPVVKVSSVKDIIRQNSASAPKKNAIQEAVAVNSVSAHTPDSKKIDKKENKKLNNENIKNVKPVSSVSKPIKTVSQPIVKKEEKPAENTDNMMLLNTASVSNAVVSDDMPISQYNEETVSEEAPVYSGNSLMDNIKGILFSPFTTIVLLTCILIMVFGFLFRKLTANLSASQSINDSFIEKLNGVLNRPKNKDFSKIVNNEKMSWQEKYKAFNSTSNTTEDVEEKDLNENYVLELAEENAVEEENNEKAAPEPEYYYEKEDNHKFKGFEHNVSKPISGVGLSKTHKLKSFDNVQTSSKETVREKLDNIIEEDSQDRAHVRSMVTNTVAKNSSAENMRIMQNSAIDKDKEFYIVNENGEYSLLGRVKNRLVILKRFGKNAPSDLQVRRGQGNSFVVKAGNFRTQVAVTDTDMNIYSQV